MGEFCAWVARAGRGAVLCMAVAVAEGSSLGNNPSSSGAPILVRVRPYTNFLGWLESGQAPKPVMKAGADTSGQMSEGLTSLTDKERQTLRLIARGHDAKSTAFHLGLSVHTINERLRIARRKLSVTSSREAARLLLDREEAIHHFLTDKNLGEAEPASDMGWIEPAKDGRKAHLRFPSILAGGAVMSLILAVLTIILNPADAPRSAVADMGVAATSVDPAVAQAARSWLELVDQGRWSESWEAAGGAFRKLNTTEQWVSGFRAGACPFGCGLVTNRAEPGERSRTAYGL